MVFSFGDKAYILENHVKVKPVMVLDRSGDVYTVQIGTGLLRIRHTRLYKTKEEAERNAIRLGDPKVAERTFGRS